MICAALASCVSAHMQMSKPFPIRSPLNMNTHGPKDYDYTSPLDPSGSNFPCKGFENDPWNSMAEYTPGGSYELSIAGSATHGGGSCQVSLSYDNGKTFRVIKSMLGSCPLPRNYNFTIPPTAPSGKALLAWSWFNKIGNREMYMNCAQVTIKDGSSKREHPRDMSPSQHSRANALDSYPPMFIANIDGPGQCETIEDEEVNFPQPGPDVDGHLHGKGYKCKSHAPFLGSGSNSSSSATTGSPSTKMVDVVAIPTSPMFAPATSSASVTPSSSATPSRSASATPSPSASGSCTDGQLICSPDGYSFSLCDHGAPVSMGPVAPGTICRNGRIGYAPPSSRSLIPTPSSSATPSSTPLSTSPSTSASSTSPSTAPTTTSAPAPTGPCTDGEIICGPGGKSFYMCDHGAPVNMGSVAAGTLCKNGRIGWP